MPFIYPFLSFKRPYQILSLLKKLSNVIYILIKASGIGLKTTGANEHIYICKLHMIGDFTGDSGWPSLGWGVTNLWMVGDLMMVDD